MHRIMLIFRPIAPKPAGGAHPSAAAEHERRKNGKRTTRKYVRVRRRQTTKRKGRSPPPDKSGGHDMEKAAVTLQLLPESENSSCCCSGEIVDRDRLRVGKEVACGGGTRAATLIVVECVTDPYVDGGVGIGFSDREIIENLQGDTCPGFVSDGGNNVVWVNDAYRRMAAGRAGAVGGEREVALFYPCVCMQSENDSADKAGAETE